MDPALNVLRRRVDALGVRARSRRYPAELRAELCAAVIAHRSRGMTVAAIATSLGVPWETLSRWTKSAPRERAATPQRGSPFRTVELVSGAGTAEVGLVVHGPAGLRIEVRDVAALADLLRKLT